MTTINTGVQTILLGRAAKFGHLDVDTERFSPTVHEYLYVYGLRQVLNDAMADKTDDDGKPLPNDQIIAKAQKRLDALYAGTLRVRGASESEPIDPLEAELHRLAKAAIHATYKAARFYDAVPKGTKNRFLAVANSRAAQRGLAEMTSDREVIERFLESSPTAKDLRKQAERNVRERASLDIDAMPV